MASSSFQIASRPLGLGSFIVLNNGVKMPILGLGTYLITDYEEVKKAIETAYDIGYRHIDTARFYDNEEAIGRAIRELNLPREELFVVTKIWYSDHGYEEAKKALEASRKRLGFDYLDLILIHFPDAGGKSVEENNKKRLETWRAMEEFLDAGKTRSIGVSNYEIKHLEALLPHVKHIPSVNQVESHPYLTQLPLHEFCKNHGILLESYSTLGKSKLLKDQTVQEIAKSLVHSSSSTSPSVTPSQVLLRYMLQRDSIVIPKSSNPSRIQENAQLFDFELTQGHLAKLDSLNKNWRCTWDPTDVL